MELTPQQIDAITELINIGYARAANALSELTGYRITLEVPSVTIHEFEALGPMLEALIKQDVASVNQKFTGPISGNAMLMLDEQSARVLSKLLGDDQSVRGEFDTNAREIITEVGNILLNACLGIFGNLLQIQVSFAVPQLQVDRITKVIGALEAPAAEQMKYGLMVRTHFNVKSGDVSGFMVIILGMRSLDRLLLEVEKWEKRQTT